MGTVVRESSIGGIYVCAAGLDILKIDKTEMVYSVPYFNLWDLELCLGDSAHQSPPWRRDWLQCP